MFAFLTILAPCLLLVRILTPGLQVQTPSAVVSQRLLPPEALSWHQKDTLDTRHPGNSQPRIHPDQKSHEIRNFLILPTST